MLYPDIDEKKPDGSYLDKLIWCTNVFRVDDTYKLVCQDIFKSAKDERIRKCAGVLLMYGDTECITRYLFSNGWKHDSFVWELLLYKHMDKYIEYHSYDEDINIVDEPYYDMFVSISNNMADIRRNRFLFVMQAKYNNTLSGIAFSQLIEELTPQNTARSSTLR